MYGVKGGQAVAVIRRLGLGRDTDGGSGGGMNRGWVEYGQDGDGYAINMCKDTVANIIFGTEPNDPLASAPGLELHHLTMSMLGGKGGRL